MSPKFMFTTDNPKAPDLPIFCPNAAAFNLMPVPTKYCVLVKSSSVFLVKARPATLRNTLSTPVTEEREALPKPEERAHGFTSKWLAPADPDLSGFPAKSVNDIPKIRVSDMIDFFMIVIRISIRSYSSQLDA
jgi:hypothetical protein